MDRNRDFRGFGHHPDPSEDFAAEVGELAAYARDVRDGLNHVRGGRSQWPFWGRLSRALRFARERGDGLGTAARPALAMILRLGAHALGLDGGPTATAA